MKSIKTWQEDRPLGAWKYMIIIIMLSLIVLVPYIWLTFQSMTDTQGNFTLANWSFLYSETHINLGKKLPSAAVPLLNSLLFASAMAASVVLVTTPAAYALSRTSFLGRRVVTKLMIVLDAFPTVALLISFVFLLYYLNLINTLTGVILLRVSMYLPGAIWLMKGFFDHVSWDIEWAAIVDGASRFKTFIRIIVPAAKPGIAVILVNSFLSGWGEFILINLFIQGGAKTMSGFISSMLNEDSRSMVTPGLMAAACIIYMVPVIIVFALSQKTLLKVRQGGSKQL